MTNNLFCDTKDCTNALTTTDLTECEGSILCDYGLYCVSCRKARLEDVRQLVLLRDRINEYLHDRIERIIPILHKFKVMNENMRGVYDVDLTQEGIAVTFVDQWRGGPDYHTVNMDAALLTGNDYYQKTHAYYERIYNDLARQAEEQRHAKEQQHQEQEEQRDKAEYERLRKKYGIPRV